MTVQKDQNIPRGPLKPMKKRLEIIHKPGDGSI